MKCSYNTRGVCPSKITFEMKDGIVSNVAFTGGCNGNLKAISKAVDGKSAKEVYDLFNGITCGYKSTSCSDQLAHAVMQAAEKEAENKA